MVDIIDGEMAVRRLENATDAFEKTISTNKDLVNVPNVGDVPSMKKRIDDAIGADTFTQVFRNVKDWAQGEVVTSPYQRYWFPIQSEDEKHYMWFAPLASTANPITLGASPIDDDNWESWDVTKQDITKAQNDIVGGSIFKGSNGDTVKNGDVIGSEFSKLRIEVGGVKYITSMDPVVFGEISELSGFECKVGGVRVNLIPALSSSKSGQTDITLSDTFDVKFQKLDLTGLKYTLTGKDKPTINIVDKSGFYKGGVVVGDDTQPTNDNAVLNIQACKGAIVDSFVVEDGYSSCSTEYGSINLPERRCESVTLTNCLFKGSYMGLESFSSFCCNIDFIATRKGRTQGSQHGLRITGYGENHLNAGKDLRNMGNNFKAVLENYANGVSRQTGVYGNLANFTASSAINGIMSTENTTLSDAISSSNNFNFAIYESNNGGAMNDPKSEMFRGTIGKCADAWVSRSRTRAATSNTYDLNVVESGGLIFEDSNSLIKVTGKDLTEGVSIKGNSNVIIAVLDGVGADAISSGLTASGNNNTIIACGSNINQQFSVFILSGNKNILIGNIPDGQHAKVALTGDFNTVSGNVEIGTVTGIGNDYSGVIGYSIKGKFEVESVNGRAFIPVNMKTGSYVPSVEILSSTGQRCSLVSASSTQIVVDVFEKDGTDAADATYTFYVKGEAY